MKISNSKYRKSAWQLGWWSYKDRFQTKLSSVQFKTAWYSIFVYFSSFCPTVRRFRFRIQNRGYSLENLEELCCWCWCWFDGDGSLIPAVDLNLQSHVLEFARDPGETTTQIPLIERDPGIPPMTSLLLATLWAIPPLPPKCYDLSRGLSAERRFCNGRRVDQMERRTRCSIKY